MTTHASQPDRRSQTHGRSLVLAVASGSASLGCRCQSYNRPDWGGDKPEVILPKPEWSSRENGVCVDACIADTILMLWANGIVTGGCCCGHNRMPPSVVLDSAADGQRAIELLRAHDGRKWNVMQWQLVTLSPPNDQGQTRSANNQNDKSVEKS